MVIYICLKVTMKFKSTDFTLKNFTQSHLHCIQGIHLHISCRTLNIKVSFLWNNAVFNINDFSVCIIIIIIIFSLMCIIILNQNSFPSFLQ